MSESHGQLLTPRQAAARLQISTGTLANWRSRGEGPYFVRVGSRIRYRSTDIDALIVDPEDDDTRDDSKGEVFFRRR